MKFCVDYTESGKLKRETVTAPSLEIAKEQFRLAHPNDWATAIIYELE